MCIIHLCSALREFLSRLQHQPPDAVLAVLTLFLLFQYVELGDAKSLIVLRSISYFSQPRALYTLSTFN